MGCGASQTPSHNPPETPPGPGSDPLPLVASAPSYAETGPQTAPSQETSLVTTSARKPVSDVSSINGQPDDKTIVADEPLTKLNEKSSEGKPGIHHNEKEMSSQVEAKFPELRTLVTSIRKNVTSLGNIRNDSGVREAPYWQTLQALNRILTASPELNSPQKKRALGLFTAEIGFVQMMAEDLKTIQAMHKNEPNYISANWKSVYYNLLVNINYTDTLPTYAGALVDNGALSAYQYFMETFKAAPGANEAYVVKVSAETMVNISRAVTVHVLRESGVVTQLIPLVRSADQSIAIASLIALAAIVDEEQNNLLMASPEPIRMIIKLLKKALDCPNHRLVQGTQWAAYELADGLSQIASNDNNKIMIVNQGGLPVIVEFLEKAANAQEQEGAARCIWMLAFNKDNVGKIKEFTNCLNQLRNLKSSPDNDVARAAAGALWELEQKEMRNEKLRQSQLNLRDSDDEEKPHIMISYQWDVQNTIVKVKNRLQQNGYRVWMDIEQMQGSTLEEMAKAVENAAVVLMCVSSKYKDSPNCRTEAEYAFQLKKEVVPLMMEPNFKPDGWLGMICGAKFWYDFREKAKSRESIEKLVKDLKERAEHAHTGFQGAIEGPKAAAAVESTDSGSDVIKWKGKDVVDWVNGLGLKNISTDCFSQFTGELLVELYKIRQEAPEFYYLSLKDELGITRLLDILKFNKALASLV